jgi:predicted CoA-binding protein
MVAVLVNVVSSEVREILRMSETIAVVGLSRNPAKDSFQVARYLQSNGYRIVPINPLADEIIGEKSYPSLKGLPDDLKASIDVVDIFRPSADIPNIVDEIILLKRRFGKPDTVWMQLGIVNEAASSRAREAGLNVVMNRCMKVEHRLLNTE